MEDQRTEEVRLVEELLGRRPQGKFAVAVSRADVAHVYKDYEI